MRIIGTFGKHYRARLLALKNELYDIVEKIIYLGL